MLVKLWLFALLPVSGQRFHAFWADAFHDGYKNPQQVDRMVEDVASANGNAIFIEIRHRGGSYYLRSLEPPAEDATYSSGFDALAYLIEKSHARGIQVHGWAPVYPLWPLTRPPRDPLHAWNLHGPSAQGEEMWMTLSAAGRHGTSLDPGHPAVSRYLADVLVEPLKHYELDGIHLDYIRYPEDADYGHNPVAVERFRRLRLPASPGTPRGQDWNDFRRRQVTGFVRQVYLRAAAIRPRAAVSAALISWGNGPVSDAGFSATDAYTRVFQDWRSWIEEGILDIGMPMLYFRESSNAAFLDRWLAFQKDRAYNRLLVPGLGAYLNPIAATLAQARRTVAAAPGGVAFYSYAVTNVEGPGGQTLEPNAGFYRQAGELLGPQSPPALPWKMAPVRGHISGRIHVDGPAWLADGATVQIEPDAPVAAPPRVTEADGTGFFGAVDLPPGRYFVRILRNGEIYRSVPMDVAGGKVAHFDIFLKADDFSAVLPRLGPIADASPGEVIRISGAQLAPDTATAVAVPLPGTLGGTQVLVNGEPAPLFSVSPGEIVAQLPFADSFEIQVRHSGLESKTVRAGGVSAKPVVTGVHLRPDGYAEIFAQGLGAVTPAVPPGTGADPAALPLVVLPVRVRWLGEGRSADIEPVFSGLAPWLPGRYQVNALLPEGWAPSQVQLIAGEFSSPAFSIQP